MKCVILAAECSSRLRPDTDDLPKTLLPVAGVPILRRTIAGFLRLGVEQFVIGTGHLEAKVREAVASWFPGLDVVFVHNPDYATTNNAYSLLLARAHVDGTAFALVDGDVVFDLTVVKQLMVLGLDCLAVRSIGGVSAEEVKVTIDQVGYLQEIGRHVPLGAARGESIGIELLSARTSRLLFAALHERVREHGLVDERHEAALQQIIAAGVALRGVDIGARYAAEIDTDDDLREASFRLSTQPRFDVRVPQLRLSN